MAERRAAHQLLDKPLVFDDPLAVRIIGARAEANLPEQPKNFVAARFRAFMAARSRFAEDELRAAVARGVRQYVVLGAGLDTFAYRNPFPDLRVFEVDHPATQAWKRKRLAQVGIPVPSSHDLRAGGLRRARPSTTGCGTPASTRSAPTFFSWLGVTMYLEHRDRARHPARDSRDARVRTASSSTTRCRARRSGFVGRLALDAVSRRVKKAGEPFEDSSRPTELVAKLRDMGYAHIEDLGSAGDRCALLQRPHGQASVGKLAAWAG